MALILGGLATELDPNFNKNYDRDHASSWQRFEHDAFGFAKGFDPVHWFDWLKQNWSSLIVVGGVAVVVVVIFLVAIKF